MDSSTVCHFSLILQSRPEELFNKRVIDHGTRVFVLGSTCFLFVELFWVAIDSIVGIRQEISVFDLELSGRSSCCWAQAVVTAIATTYRFVRGEDLPPLSAREMQDSLPKKSRLHFGLAYVIKHGGLIQESEYEPQHLGRHFMRYGHIDGYKMINVYNEAELFEAIKQRPLLASFEVTEDFQNYKDGVCLGRGRIVGVHAMLVIGFCTIRMETGKVEDCWIVQNIWGLEWGSNGCAFVVRNSRDCSRMRLLDAIEIDLAAA
ncbi:hypothetical protein CRG98_000479 [Punica granatum]|uniref:Peptidase C1A papain C-terminal domain-containing protein n=1 Tax=Punica granatum TaxID=22663 RepID=A0A2I0LES5_PUNGR|nr:hypothetical protein CRG98_000479 [Punica granatum]